MVATISEETSVSMLVIPSMITVRLTRPWPRRAPAVARARLRMSWTLYIATQTIGRGRRDHSVRAGPGQPTRASQSTTAETTSSS